MTFLQIVKCAPLLPGAWISSIKCKDKDPDDNFFICQSLSNKVLKSLGYELQVEGVDNIPETGALYYVSNHQGTLDPVLIIASSTRPVGFISKIENEKLPIMGRWAIDIGTIHFDRESRSGNIYMLRESTRRMKKGKNLLIFPEGTRSKGDAMNEFKNGSLQPAYMAKATILPVTLNNAYCIDDSKDKNRKLKITYGKPIPYSEYKDIKQTELNTKLHEIIEANILTRVRNVNR